MGIVGGALALGGAILGSKSAKDQAKAATNAANTQAAGIMAAGNRSANTFSNLLGVGNALTNYYNPTGKTTI